MRPSPRNQHFSLPFSRAALTLFFLMAPMFPGSLEAQVVRGRLLDNQSGEPAENGMVILLDGQGRNVASTMSDSLGRFELTAPRPGRYTIRATSLGYRRGFPAPVDLTGGGEVSADIYLDPAPVELDSILVEVEGRRIIPQLATQGFYERVDQGFGDFITPEEIERRNPIYFSDLFRNIPGVSVSIDGGITMRDCSPRIWVDGILVRSALSELLLIGDIQAVEVYRRASSTPLQYGGTGGRCAVIIWTKSAPIGAFSGEQASQG